MWNKIGLNIIILLSVYYCNAQETLDPDRPGHTKTPELVKGNNLQFEAGVRKERIDNTQFLYQHPNALLRYGLFNALELRMEVTSQTVKNKSTKQDLRGLTPVYFGVKAKILPAQKWLPSIGALAQVGVPSLASGDYFVDGIPFEFRVLFNSNVNSRFYIQYNAGVAWNETNNHVDNKQWTYSISPVYKVKDKIAMFIEEYAFVRSGTAAEHYFDGGLQYFVNKDFALDLSAGRGLSNRSSDYFVEGGLAYRLSFSK